MKKKYSVKDLATILGCSITAVNKKIKSDPDNPVIRRYRNVFDTVIEDGVTYILLTDEELEQEKTRSKGFSNLLNRGYTTPQNEEVIDVEPYEEQERKEDKLMNFAERYINDFTTLQKTYYEEMREKDKQIFLLTTSENQKQTEYLKTEALNKTLTKRNNVLQIALTVAITLLLTFIVLYTTVLNQKNEKQTIEEKQPVQTVQQPIKQPSKPVAKRR